MATQSYMDRNTVKKKIDVTRLAQRQAPGHPPELQPRDGAENRTPSPTREPTTTSLEISRSRSWGRAAGSASDNPGAMGAATPSSLNPGERAGPATIDPLGPAGADPVLENLRMGTARAVDQSDDWQTRQDVSREQYPAAFGHRLRTADAGSPGGTVPKHCGAPVNDDSAARRDAAVKRASE